MRRARTGLRIGNSVDVHEGEQGFWPSFADMMSSFALILFFLMLISYLQNLITGNRLVSTEDRLAETEKTLASTVQQVESAKDELALLTIDLDDSKQALALQQAEMAQYAATIAGQNVTIREQENYIALTNDELTRLRAQMQTIALLRLSILNQIKKSIGTALGSENRVSIGDNGSIILSEGLFFDFNSAVIKSESHPLLNELTNAFSLFLSDPENAKYVDSIVISGHTDNIGTAGKNRKLSTERANAVLDYLLEENGNKLAPYASYFCGAGYGATRPVADNSTDAGRSANRRIEISIILKDETVLEIVNAYLAQEMPAVSAAPVYTPTPMP